MRSRNCFWVVALVIFTCATRADTLREEIEERLAVPILEQYESSNEIRDFARKRVPIMPQFENPEEWESAATNWREDTLEQVVFRGEAARAWRGAEVQIKWLETIEGGPGYNIRKLIYAILPGLWVPALLYEPDSLSGNVPVVLNLNGHDVDGKAADYKQIRCINQAKRGMLALNVEWLGTGQLETDGFDHYRINQIDLCGVSGLAPHYLQLSKGLDILLSHPNADPNRVAATGLSGGGWQALLISALDTRVTICNPVAGYSSFKTRAVHHRDLGDSEQTPNDLATVVDYTHLTAMLAPRPALLTYNATDHCCFLAENALPRLLDAASPIYALYGKENHFQTHINTVPGTHNFEQDNREALYQFIGEFFYTDDPSYSPVEIDSEAEVKTSEELSVPLPDDNLDFAQLATALALELPRSKYLPQGTGSAAWKQDARTRLADIVRYPEYGVSHEEISISEGAARTTFWRLNLDNEWTLPVVEFVPVEGQPIATTLLVADEGRKAVAEKVESLLGEEHRVLAVDPYYFGESATPSKDWLFALLLAAVGERPLGIQAAQLTATAGWAMDNLDSGPLHLESFGPRSSTFALIAAGLEPQLFANVIVHEELASLQDILGESGSSALTTPELFCFGLLEQFDIDQLKALATPNDIRNSTLTWEPPQQIIFGTQLGAEQLNATSDVPGSFVYDPPAGILLDTGQHTLNVLFTPDDTVSFTSSTEEVQLSVNPRIPMITWQTPEPIAYGAALGVKQLNATADSAGTFAYDPSAETLVDPGEHTLSAMFTPDDSGNVTNATATVLLTVHPRIPVITWVTPQSITFGDAISSRQFNATADVPGSFIFAPRVGTVFDVGEHTLDALFTPDDSKNFRFATAAVQLSVVQRKPIISWEPPQPITYGTAVTEQQLNATGDVPGSFSFTPTADTVLDAGEHTLDALFTPHDSNNFTTATAAVSLTVHPRVPTLTWESPSSMVFGEELGAGQLNAAANVPGSFTYDPPAKTVLETGEHSLKAHFKPQNLNNFSAASIDNTLRVFPRTPVLQWAPNTLTFGTALGAAQLNATADVPGTFAYDPPAGTVLGVGPHRADLTFQPEDERNHSAVTISEALSVVAALGDLNVDGNLNAADIDLFLLAFIDPEDYKKQTGQDPLSADANGDGALNTSDIDPFVQLLTDAGTLQPDKIPRLNRLAALKSPKEDGDNDGVSNTAELFAGTDPFDSSDFFRVNSVTVIRDVITVHWASVAGKYYAIEYSPTAATESWTVVNDTAVTAEGATTSFSVPTESRSSGFYRIRVNR
jgi:dienelactone hydrolase